MEKRAFQRGKGKLFSQEVIPQREASWRPDFRTLGSTFWMLSVLICGTVFTLISTLLMSHYRAIGDTISCDAPCSATGFRGKLFLRYRPPLQGLPLDWDRPFFLTERSGGVAAIVCDTRENAVQQGYCYTCPAIGGGGYSSRVTKYDSWRSPWQDQRPVVVGEHHPMLMAMNTFASTLIA